MKFRNTMLAAAASAALAVSGVAVAQPPMGEWHHGGGMEFLHGITLSDAQKAQVQQIHKATWTQMKPIMEQMRSIHEQIVNQMLAAGKVTAEAFTPMVQQEEALRSQMDSIHLNETLQLRDVLTSEQLAQAAATHTKLEALHAEEHAVMSGEPTEE
jgi:Spy/CpxP family protein refolding chaperone